jgi:hypothetical protein
MRHGWSLGELAGDFQVKMRKVDLDALGPKLVLKQDPNRWGFILSNNSGDTLSFGPDPATGTGFNVTLASLGDRLELHFRAWGGLVQVAWYGLDFTRAGSVTVVEVLYLPQGAEEPCAVPASSR